MQTVDEDQLAALLDRFVNDLGATMAAGNVVSGTARSLPGAGQGRTTPSTTGGGDGRRAVRQRMAGREARPPGTSITTPPRADTR